MWKLAIGLYCALSIFGANAHEEGRDHEHNDAQPVTVQDAWVREAPPTSKTTAVYMKLHNSTAETLALLSAESPQFNKVEIHNTIIENNVAKMIPVEKLEIPAHQMVELKPKGLHIMLIEAKSGTSPTSNDMVEIKLHFSNQQVETLQVPVKKGNPMANADDHSHHHH
ncbi:MAG: hypothetical protein RIT27_2486 [Pseudomonadota bacterium]|jgi:copper(I)-binding protein